MREPVELDEDHARLVITVALPLPSSELAHECPEERIVVAGREYGGHECVHDRKDHRPEERVHRRIDRDRTGTREEPKREALKKDRDARRNEDGDLREVGDEDRPEECSHRGENDRRDEGSCEVAQPDAGDQPRGGDEGEGGHANRCDAPADQRAGASGPAERQMELGRVEVDHDRRIRLGR